MEFTKEQLIEHVKGVINTFMEAVVLYPDNAGMKMDLHTAEIALASLEAEPYGYVHKAIYEVVGSCGLTKDHEAYRDSPNHIAVYTAPPAPISVPDALPENDDEEGNDIDYMEPSEVYASGRAAGWNACRAAMQGKAEPGKFPAVNPIDHGFRADCECSGCKSTARICADLCWCRTCRPVTFADSHFVVCPECGNKRCPHANDHRNACTGSNEPGQEGSAYPAAPQQEVK